MTIWERKHHTTQYEQNIMASMLPLGEKHQAFANREEIHAPAEEAVSIHFTRV